MDIVLNESQISEIAAIVSEQIGIQLRDAGMLLSENEARRYREYCKADDKLLSGADAAKLLNVSPGTITKMRQSGQIKAKLIGRTWKYNKRELLKLK